MSIYYVPVFVTSSLHNHPTRRCFFHLHFIEVEETVQGHTACKVCDLRQPLSRIFEVGGSSYIQAASFDFPKLVVLNPSCLGARPPSPEGLTPWAWGGARAPSLAPP